MQKKIAFFDLDNTLYDGYSLFDIVENLGAEGYFSSETQAQYEQIVAPYRRGRGDRLKISGEVLDLFLDNVKGRSSQELSDRLKVFWEKGVEKLISQTSEKMKDLQKRGYEIAIITGSPDLSAIHFCRHFKIAKLRAAELESHQETLTGGVKRNSTVAAKNTAAISILGEGTYTLKDSYGFGDEPGDYGFLQLVENAFIVEGCQKVRELDPRRR